MTLKLLTPTEAQKQKGQRSHFDNPDENLQLVNVELQVHSVGQPRSQQVHGAGVPLLWWTHKKETHKSISPQRELSGFTVQETRRPPLGLWCLTTWSSTHCMDFTLFPTGGRKFPNLKSADRFKGEEMTILIEGANNKHNLPLDG